MDRKKLINLVEKIQSAEGTEEEIHENINKFESSVLDPNATEYLFAKEFEKLSDSEVVDKCLSYKSIKLPLSFE